MKRLSLLAISLLILLSTITFPAPAAARSGVDIVFLIDQSGSMGPSINAVQNNVNHFADLLAARGISYRLGLVTYETYVTRMDLTSDVNAFKGQVSQINVFGGTENGLDAIMNAAQNYPFDVNASKYFILIGDENIYSEQGYMDANVIEYLKSNNITLTVIGTESIKPQLEQFSNATGGQYLNLYSDFSTSLTSIFDQIQRIPTLEIVSPSTGQMLSDLNTTIPTIKVTDPDSDALQLAYYVDAETSPRDTKTVSNTMTAQTVSFNALDIAALAEGNHTMKFTVNDGSETVQDTVSFRVDKASPVLAEPSIVTTATTIQITGSATDGVSGLHSAPYRFSVGSAPAAWTASTTHTQSGLTPNTAYPVSFEARDAAGHVGTVTRSVLTDAQVPVVVKGPLTETSIELSMQDSNPALTAYQIKAGSQYVNASGGVTSTPSWITLTGKKIKVTGLAPNTDYTFQAKARNASNKETDLSTALSVRTLANPPSNVSTQAEQRWIKLSWPGTAGATHYEVEADGTVLSAGASTSYTHNGLAPNTKHTYRVRVNNAGGTGGWSQPVTVFTLPDPPAIPSGVKALPLQTEMTISWDAVALAESYDVEVDGVIQPAGSGLTYKHTGLQPKTEHTYRVRAANAGGIGQWSEPVIIRTLPYPPPTPEGLSGQPLIHQVTIQWKSSNEADGYEIEMDGQIVNNGNQLTYVHEGLRPLTNHTYRVRAVNAGGKSGWSAPLDIKTHPEKPVKPTNVMTTADQQSITLMWYQVAHAEDYEVELDGGQVVTVTDNQFLHEGLKPDTGHTYRIRARNISGYSDWTAPAKMTTFPSGENGQNLSLTNMAAIVTNRAITISWDTVAPNAKYEIEVDGIMSDNGDNTIFHHGGLQANEFHTYKIRLKNDSGPGTWVAVLSLSTLPDPPDAPPSLEAFGSNNMIELRWDLVNGASGYDLEIDGETVDAGSSDEYIHEQLAPGTSHTYRLRAKNETGVTAWSPAITQSTTSPTYWVDGKLNQTFDLSLLAFNVQDFSELTFVVEYNPDELEIADLYQYTPEADLMTEGAIPGSGLDVTFAPGRITYKLRHNIVPGTSWSGEVATVVFKSKINGRTAIDVVVE